MPPFRYLQNCEPRVVLKDIYKNKINIVKRNGTNSRASGSQLSTILEPENNLSSASRSTIYRKKRNNKIKTSKSSLIVPLLVPKIEKDIKVVEKRRRVGRPPKVNKDILVNAILSRKSDILDSDGLLVPVSNPTWLNIKKELNNKLTIYQIYNTAKTLEVIEQLGNNLENNNDHKNNIPTLPTADSVEIEESTNDINTRSDNTAEIFERALTKLVSSIDCLTKQIIELRNEIRGINDN